MGSWRIARTITASFEVRENSLHHHELLEAHRPGRPREVDLGHTSRGELANELVLPKQQWSLGGGGHQWGKLPGFNLKPKIRGRKIAA